MAQKKPQATYSRMRVLLAAVVEDFRTLSGDQVGPSGASWQAIARESATRVKALAEQLEQAAKGNHEGGLVFPSPDDLEDSDSEGTEPDGPVEVTVKDLEFGDTSRVLLCGECGNKFSADRHDYFTREYTEPFMCCDEPCQLVVKRA